MSASWGGGGVVAPSVSGKLESWLCPTSSERSRLLWRQQHLLKQPIQLDEEEVEWLDEEELYWGEEGDDAAAERGRARNSTSERSTAAAVANIKAAGSLALLPDTDEPMQIDTEDSVSAGACDLMDPASVLSASTLDAEMGDVSVFGFPYRVSWI